MTIVALVILLGLATGLVARYRGYGFWTWAIAGALLFVVAFPAALLVKNKRTG